jgi:hypothetical protein
VRREAGIQGVVESRLLVRVDDDGRRAGSLQPAAQALGELAGVVDSAASELPDVDEMQLLREGLGCLGIQGKRTTGDLESEAHRISITARLPPLADSCKKTLLMARYPVDTRG